MHRLRTIFTVFSALACLILPATAADFPPLRLPEGDAAFGQNLQRTMRLLAESTPERRNTVRVLFYGQSITEQGWWKTVADDLRRRFPHADLVIENRALGGFASQMLVKTAETDLYPFQPDLLIFHVYGAHDKYEDIIRRTRERTSAEILIQTDHVTKPADLTEETDPAKVPIQSGKWDAFFNYNFLPSMARKYSAELCDQRTLWKNYLKENNLEPKALLKDGVHLNEHGEFLMAEIVKAHLRRYFRFDPAAGESVTTRVIDGGLPRKNGKLHMEFEGNRVDVVCRPGTAAPAAVRIDGRKPSEFSGAYGFTRAVTEPEGKWPVKWPVIAPIGSEKPLLSEDWTLEVRRTNGADEKLLAFTLTGSKTGPDGEGRSDQRFVSKSGRIILSPEDWNVEYALALAGIKPVPETFTVKWSTERHFVDDFLLPATLKPGIETTVTLAQGLPNAKHTLEITGEAADFITAVRIYRPALRRE